MYIQEKDPGEFSKDMHIWTEWKQRTKKETMYICVTNKSELSTSVQDNSKLVSFCNMLKVRKSCVSKNEGNANLIKFGQDWVQFFFHLITTYLLLSLLYTLRFYFHSWLESYPFSIQDSFSSKIHNAIIYVRSGNAFFRFLFCKYKHFCECIFINNMCLDINLKPRRKLIFLNDIFPPNYKGFVSAPT